MLDYIKKKVLESEVDPEWKQFMMSENAVIIYGAGRQARIVIDFCNMFGKKIFCLMTTDSIERWGLLPREEELALYLLREFPDEYEKAEYDVIIALNSKFNAEIEALLKKENFTNIFAIQDWEKENNRIRELYYKNYFLWHGAEFFRDEQGIQYLVYPYQHGTFRMYFPEDAVFLSNTVGELGNIVMPALFDDAGVSCLGPYEYGEHVRLHKGDVVFDLGANIGLFSCVAAAKGCKVYAFEPEGIPVYQYLQKNAQINPEAIEVIPNAVGRQNGKCLFYYNDNLDTDYDMCQSSIHPELNPVYKETTVDMITLDSFVEKWKIPKVDFIKSHIEYAENEMLEGAQETIRRFSPVLSFYSQKALGLERYKEVEERILQANPDYKIIYYKRRVYAYVLK